MGRRLALALFAVALACAPLEAKDPSAWPWAYPGGVSTQRIQGLGVTLFVPRRLTPKSGSSLLVLLHGARAKASNLATFFRYWPRKNYVVCAPQASGPVWRPDDLARVRRIVQTLRTGLPIDPEKLHVAGFSNGASNLHAIAFAPDMRARSGTWVGGGFGGGPVPAWARERFGALFMAGENDFALPRVRSSPARLQGRVRSVELHVEPDIAHTWPTSQIEYHLWWMGVQEGRFTPGDDLNFDWDDDLADALEAVKTGQAPGAFLYLYDSVADVGNASTRALQTVAFMDPEVRRLGRRLRPVMLDKRGSTAVLARLGVPALATPALVVFGPKARVTLTGPISAGQIRHAFAGLLR